MSSIERMVEKLKLSTSNGGVQRKAVERKPVGKTPSSASPGRTAKQREAGFTHIDMGKLENFGFFAPPQDRAKLAEEYRRIKRPLLSNAFGKTADAVELGNVIMVASAMSGEGKTFNTINLALSMANEMDITVLVVDLDVLNPALTRLLELDEKLGLTDVLSDPDVELADVILSTNVPKLKILPAGRRHTQANELLASDQMQRVTHELSTRYPDRIVIFDAPPLLLTSEANVVAGLVGQVLLIVEAGETPQNAVKEAVALLDERKVIGIVLNKYKGSGNGPQYGSYYAAYGEEQG
ncbi:MAG TPA: tyrosine-protein kinase family protein [Gammaproteobacteria bacterium]|nr:tyrosine-protein kinase family protein [Gammaproteobacteria bacterium]